MRRRTALVAVAGAAVVATAGIAIVAVGVPGGGADGAAGPSGRPTGVPAPGASPASGTDSVQLAEAFLADWVDDGRVVRRDQGGDTVSEGQAYGLLAATVADDERAVDEIWRWTTENLQRPDGLLGWRWEDGEVVDDEPASDAGLDAARALVVAGERFDRPDLTAAGVELSTEILDRLTVATSYGRILLPGLWAASGQPWAYNPSYASPAAFAVLGEASADPRWAELSAGSAAVTTAILAGTDLPPDWAQVHADGRIDPMPGGPRQRHHRAVRLRRRAARAAVRGVVYPVGSGARGIRAPGAGAGRRAPRRARPRRRSAHRRPLAARLVGARRRGGRRGPQRRRRPRGRREAVRRGAHLLRHRLDGARQRDADR